jgi:nicotinamide-nucleotide amidase
MKTSMLDVEASLISQKTAVCEEVAIQMVKGAIEKLGVDYAIASTGFAGPGTADGIPVGTIWIACGNKDEQITLKLSEDEGREKNISNAVDKALEMAFSFIQEHEPARIGDEAVELIAE